ncbi:MAG: HigA family addiction module antidote protein [Leptolyngbyaceae cyanobacterium RM2_2_4]|nr:HigA family addiction module antidote protein [Leptolyngbyaceae cyanobacterium RM2_2_4]
MNNRAIQNQYTPDFVSPPGETLLEVLEEQGMTQAELAERTGRPKKTINEIVKGKAALTPETALQLERVLGIPARFWNNREQQYREALARQEERERLQTQTDWLEQVPVREMIKRGWIESCDDPIELLKIVLGFFGVASPQQWQEIWSQKAVSFRKSTAFESHPGAIAAWLRQGEIQAQQVSCDPYDAGKFRAALQQIRALTVQPPEIFQPEMVRLCAAAGVAVVFVPQLTKTRASGATQWLSSSKALIQLSLRYKTDDHLWFAFFHEAGHLLLHGKREVFLEGAIAQDSQKQDLEMEADTFAAGTLIPPDTLEQFLKLRQRSKAAIEQFAAKIGIAPGIVVGRLQHDDVLPNSHCNDLKQRFEWAE